MKKFINAILLLSALLMATSVFAAPPASTTTPQPTAATQNTFTPEQTQQIQQIVHDYLLQNPQVMVQVFKKLQTQQRAKMQQKADEAIKANAQQLFNSTNSPTVGNPQGKVTLVEFFDYQCPHCRAMTPVIKQLVQKNPDLRVVYKELPIFPGSTFVSKAALAAMQQGKYQAFHNALMKASIPIKKEEVLKVAKSVGINTEELQKAMNSTTVEAELKQNLQLARALQLFGTPAFIIGANVNSPNNIKIFFIPGQVSAEVLQGFITKAQDAQS